MEAVLTRPSAAEESSRHAKHAAGRVLVADAEREVTESLRNVLLPHGFVVVAAGSSAEALATTNEPLQLALVDLDSAKTRGRAGSQAGLELIHALRQRDRALSIIALVPAGAADLAVDAMRRGAREVLEKPWHEGRLLAVLRCQAEIGHSMRRVADLEAELQKLQTTAFSDMRLLDVEGTLVKQALSRFNGNISRTARALGLSRSALYRRLERHKLS